MRLSGLLGGGWSINFSQQTLRVWQLSHDHRHFPHFVHAVAARSAAGVMDADFSLGALYSCEPSCTSPKNRMITPSSDGRGRTPPGHRRLRQQVHRASDSPHSARATPARGELLDYARAAQGLLLRTPPLLAVGGDTHVTCGDYWRKRSCRHLSRAAAGFRRISRLFPSAADSGSRISRMAPGSLYAPLLCLAKLRRMPAPSPGKSVKCGPISSST